MKKETILDIILIILTVVFMIIVGKIIIDLMIYNKCFVNPFDSNFNYNICTYYTNY